MAKPRAKKPATHDEAGTPVGEHPEGHQALRPRLTVTCDSCGTAHEIGQPTEEEMEQLIPWECHAQLGMVDSPDGGEVPLICGKRNIVEGSGTKIDGLVANVNQNDPASVYLHAREQAAYLEGTDG